jgi:hypothetical protein
MSKDPIGSIDKITRGNAEAFSPTKIEPSQGVFDSLMRKTVETTENKDLEISQIDKRGSLMDAVAKLNEEFDSVKNASLETIVHKSHEVIAKIDEAKERLKTPGLELDPAERTLLKSKLNHVDEGLKVLMENAGVEYRPPSDKLSGMAAPIHQFIGLLTHGQSQLENLTAQIKAVAAEGKDLSPATMLLMQVKVNRIQQSVELFVAMLNKGLESTKTIMNVQV